MLLRALKKKKNLGTGNTYYNEILAIYRRLGLVAIAISEGFFVLFLSKV